MVPDNSRKISRVPRYSGALSLINCLPVRGFHPLWPHFPIRSGYNWCDYSGPITPILPKQHWFGLFPVRSPLLGESLLFSSPVGNEMFQFPTFASLAGWYPFRIPGCPIRKSPDQILFANPRCLSQLITSFFASESQGILRAPFSTFFSTHYFGVVYFGLPVCQWSFRFLLLKI